MTTNTYNDMKQAAEEYNTNFTNRFGEDPWWRKIRFTEEVSIGDEIEASWYKDNDGSKSSEQIRYAVNPRSRINPKVNSGVTFLEQHKNVIKQLAEDMVYYEGNTAKKRFTCTACSGACREGCIGGCVNGCNGNRSSL